ncbi:hypothetical protein PVAP13_2KG009128 [Panicum virgatum]|uniref:Uncharacterized protein n=1 Tax=Panicum virgatum TaxID=38727 RepID=A0A8T0VTN7_PANVG|nr:hypothetical protein PVAP13_2KG009128 [Panicum virgatum]
MCLSAAPLQIRPPSCATYLSASPPASPTRQLISSPTTCSGSRPSPFALASPQRRLPLGARMQDRPSPPPPPRSPPSARHGHEPPPSIGVGRAVARCWVRRFATQLATSSLRDSSPNWSNRPPKETILLDLLDGCAMIGPHRRHLPHSSARLPRPRASSQPPRRRRLVPGCGASRPSRRHGRCRQPRHHAR